jgi:hypothetical protein
MLSLWISRRRYGIWSRVLYVAQSSALRQCIVPQLIEQILQSGCGDVADITNNGGKTAAESDCAMPCTGDPLHLCGGFWMLQLYLWEGNLSTWNTPANIGRYEVLTFRLECKCKVEGPST